MLRVILSDLSHVLLRPKNKTYVGSLNALHQQSIQRYGEDYDAYRQFELNHRPLDFYVSLKGRCSVSVFTTDSVQNHRQLRQHLDPVFEYIFAAKEYGLSKRDPAAYVVLAQRLRVRPEEVVYVDDAEDNVAAAQKAAMTAVRHVNDDRTISILSALLSDRLPLS
jgi:HAD superfamily hydrolase (TIGR01549 family)